MSWNLDTTHSAAAFGVKHMMISNVKGRFDKFSVDVDIDEADLAASRATITIDVASVETGEAQRDEHLRSADFFDATNHPQIVFATKRLEPRGDGEFRFIGDLTIRGVTKEVVLEGEVSGPQSDPWGGTRYGISVEGKLDRREWGLDFNLPLGGGGVVVGNNVKLSFDAELVKAA
jgi:polyisoprenoid-binding protein YceI